MTPTSRNPGSANPDSAPLSERELDVLRLLVTGMTNRQIARDLAISPNTVKVHLRNIFEKLGVQSRTEASMIAVSEGWLAGLGAPESSRPQDQPLRRPTIALWQRCYLIAAVIAAVAVAAIPLVRQLRHPASADSDLQNSALLANLGGLLQPADQWEGRSFMPTARSRHALVSDEGLLYAIAGQTLSGITGSVEVYDPEADVWAQRSAKPSPVSNIEGVLLAGNLVIPGGYQADGTLTAVTEAYDPSADQWKPRASMPEPLCAYAAAAIGDRMYIFGGWGEAGFVSSAYVYDLSDDRWQHLPPLHRARGFASAAAVDGRIFVAGGYDGQSEIDTVEVFNPNAEDDQDPWTIASRMTQPRGGLQLVASGSELYAIGGGWRQTIEFNERYDLASDTWSTIASPLTDQWIHLGASALDGRIFAIGGWSNGLLAVNEEYRTLQYRILLPLGSKSGE